MSLFSVFDPVGLFGRNNWLVLLMLFMMLWSSRFLVVGGIFSLKSGLMIGVFNVFRVLSFPYGEGVVLVVGGLFFCVVFLNLLGLVPYIFCVTSHIVFTLGLGLTLWFSSVIMGWSCKFNYSVGHLVPEGSPMVLVPVLVIIELISHLIRPVTLSVRLAANMMAGHLIVSLISEVSVFGGSVFLGSVFVQLLLLVLELGVCIIQGVVFGVLLLLYYMEYY